MKTLTQKLSIFFVLCLIANPIHAQRDTLRIVTYNLLNFPGSTGNDRVDDFRMVINSFNPDILIVQELISESGQQTFLSEVLNFSQSDLYAAVPFINGMDTDNSLFYKQNKINFISNQQISTALRDISEYVLENSGVEFRIYSLHLKASLGSENEVKRLNEVTILRNYLNNLSPYSNFIVTGDFNIYNAAEPAFIWLIEDQKDNGGRLFDPLDMIGNWHNNGAFAAIHTQSTRTLQFGGGASGGLDDRFDMLLVSDSVLEDGGMFILKNTYTAFGNDGNHFNLAINNGNNSSVPDSIADALHTASDHLPVYADFVFDGVNFVKAINPTTFSISQNYPNPFTSETKFEFTLLSSNHVSIKLYNLLGQEITTVLDENRQSGVHEVSFSDDSLPAGLYILRINIGGLNSTKYITKIR